jgi:hypothetical protein
MKANKWDQYKLFTDKQICLCKKNGSKHLKKWLSHLSTYENKIEKKLIHKKTYGNNLKIIKDKSKSKYHFSKTNWINKLLSK